MDPLNYSLGDVWEELKDTRPLIYQLTNTVAAQFSANVTLAAGASPMMSLHPGEAEDLARAARGLLVNTGTPTEDGIKAIRKALQAVSEDHSKPVLLDPVGYGVSPFRRHLVDYLLQNYRISIIKGNRGEMAFLGKAEAEVTGMDSIYTENLKEPLFSVSQSYNCLAIATGETDYLADGTTLYSLRGGHRLMTMITAGGCALGSLICACSAACGDSLRGSLAGLAAMAIASERASGTTAHPGSFAVSILDQLAVIEPADLKEISERLSVLEVGN